MSGRQTRSLRCQDRSRSRSRLLVSLSAASALILGATAVSPSRSTGGSGTPPCALSDAGVLTLKTPSDIQGVRRRGDEILVNSGIACSGEPPTVFNTAKLVVEIQRRRRVGSFHIDTRGGPFAPGVGPAESGDEEIEFEVHAPDPHGFQHHAVFVDGKGAQAIRLGRNGSENGIDLNPDDPVPDADVALDGIEGVAIFAGRGDDRLVADQAPGFQAPFRLGLNAAGGAGHDVLKGGDGNDIVTGGDGHDVLKGGDGFDFIRSKDSPPRRDRVDCGSGHDRAIVDPKDRARRCERINGARTLRTG